LTLEITSLTEDGALRRTKSALDHVIFVCMDQPSLEFVWVGDDAVDPLQQAQTLQILVSSGIKAREEAREELGLGPAGGKELAGGGPAGLGKLNPYCDAQGRFTTADDAAAAARQATPEPQPGSHLDSARRALANDSRYAFAGVLIDKRYDENIDITHCTYRTPFGTYTLEYKGYASCPETTPAP